MKPPGLVAFASPGIRAMDVSSTGLPDSSSFAKARMVGGGVCTPESTLTQAPNEYSFDVMCVTLKRADMSA